jgi:hypothetical protein
VMRQAFAPVGTRLRKAAATEDGGESVFGDDGGSVATTARLSVPPPLNSLLKTSSRTGI